MRTMMGGKRHAGHEDAPEAPKSSAEDRRTNEAWRRGSGCGGWGRRDAPSTVSWWPTSGPPATAASSRTSGSTTRLSDPSLIEIDEERALYWLRVGAQPSNQVRNLMSKVGIWETFVKERPSAAGRRQDRSPSAPRRRRSRRRRRRRPPRPRRPRRRRSRAGRGRRSREPRPVEAAEPSRPTEAGRGSAEPSRRRPRPEVKELVEFLCRELVDDPDAVRVAESFDERGSTYSVTVGPGELGKVIGRGGPHRQGDPHGRPRGRVAPEPRGPRRLRGLRWTSRRSSVGRIAKPHGVRGELVRAEPIRQPRAMDPRRRRLRRGGPHATRCAPCVRTASACS